MAKNCRKCRNPKPPSQTRQVERSPDGRRVNRRKEQRAAKKLRMQELAAAAEHIPVESGSGEAVSESVVSVEQTDSHDLTHGGEIEFGKGNGPAVPSSEIIEQVAHDQGVSGVAAPDVGEGL